MTRTTSHAGLRQRSSQGDGGRDAGSPEYTTAARMGLAELLYLER